jgi:hypothetical protein
MRRMRERNPEEFRELRRLRQEDPGAFREALREKAMRHRDGRGPGHLHPLAAEIEALRTAETDEAREAAEADLREKLGELIDRRMRLREERVEQIRAQLRELEEQHERDLERRGELIEQSMDRIRTRLAPPPEAEPEQARPNEP